MPGSAFCPVGLFGDGPVHVLLNVATLMNVLEACSAEPGYEEGPGLK